MTREEFLAGVPFHWLANMKNKPYQFVRWPDWKNGDPVGSLNYFGQNEANISRIGYTYFDCYSTILGKVIRARFHFKDLHA
jgi:hypothetical protein